MSTIQIKNVPQPLHAELRRRARESRLTVRDYVLRLIERDQVLPTTREWLDHVGRLESVRTNLSSAELVRQVREDREDKLAERMGISADPIRSD